MFKIVHRASLALSASGFLFYFVDLMSAVISKDYPRASFDGVMMIMLRQATIDVWNRLEGNK